MFVVGYAQTEAAVSVEEKGVFSADLHNVGKRVPTKERLIALMDANALIGSWRYGGRGMDRKVLGVFRCDGHNNNGERLLDFGGGN